jgi:hypothetical protein
MGEPPIRFFLIFDTRLPQDALITRMSLGKGRQEFT